MTTGFVFDEVFLSHRTGAGHPECAERLSATMDHLTTLPLYDKLNFLNALPAQQEFIETSHSAAYLARARHTCVGGSAFLDSMDTAVGKESFDIALKAAGASIALADGVIDGEISNGFALVRPPGHHAEREQAMGFCILNNVAILARYLQAHHGLDKVMILDWDVHHGNGTQHTFEEDPSVLFVSTHQYPFYPGTGAWSETGIGRGSGATVNCPMPAGCGDEDYEAAFMEKILPAIDGFKPEFVIISAGFDAHRDDPLGDVNLSTGFYGWMTSRVMEVADQHAGGRIVSVLEGGYNLAMLPLCIEEHLKVLSTV